MINLLKKVLEHKRHSRKSCQGKTRWAENYLSCGCIAQICDHVTYSLVQRKINRKLKIRMSESLKNINAKYVNVLMLLA